MVLPLLSEPKLKKVEKRQSKSLSTVLPTSQRPSARVGGTSVAVTVTEKPVLTVGICSWSTCALASVQGLAGVGLGFEGQSKGACSETLVPGLKVTLTDVGGGTKSAETFRAEETVRPQVPKVPDVAQALLQPP